MRRVLYRLVQYNPPRREDFVSFEALGRQPQAPSAEVLRLWSGISMYETVAQARRLGKKRPWLGRFIVRVEIDDTRVVCERTGSTPGHYTLWADADVFRSSVLSIEPV